MQQLKACVLMATMTLLCGGALSACGQKGPLYLPQDSASTADSPAADTDTRYSADTDASRKPSND